MSIPVYLGIRKGLRRWNRNYWFEAILAFLTDWDRFQVIRVVAAVALVWLLGAAAMHFVEETVNPDFESWSNSFWSVGVLLFSGLDQPPKTALGRLVAMAIIVFGVGTAGLFTASVASLLIERYMWRREVSNMELEDHLVLCNWSPRGLEWIRQVHSKAIQSKRPVIIIHDEVSEIDLPDKIDEPAFNDVYIVKGDPTSEVILRRAKVSKAHSVVILTDDREGKYADGKSVLTCITIRNICRGSKQPNIAAECLSVANRHHLEKAGADEIISSDELGLRLLARTALFHGMTRVYQELLTVGRDANEIYLFPAPEALLGKDFIELTGMFLRYRGDRRACTLIGIHRSGEMMLNPIDDEAGPLQAGDQLLLMSRVFLDPSQPLPTDPPISMLESSSST